MGPVSLFVAYLCEFTASKKVNQPTTKGYVEDDENISEGPKQGRHTRVFSTKNSTKKLGAPSRDINLPVDIVKVRAFD
uniref:Uncharacterized protein n=1 Tax=Ditylenchus dipsaci TaxID=166011 RepID=A0A915DUK3_9BILA